MTATTTAAPGPAPPTRCGPHAGPYRRRPAAADERVLVEDDLLVEDVSIDGMCGVY